MNVLQRVCNKINTSYTTQLSEVPPKSDIRTLKNMLQDYVIMKGDSAATSHYIRPQDKDCLSNINAYNGPSVMLPDADKIAPSHQGSINLNKDLSSAAKLGTVLPQLQTSSLLSLGQLCDDGCDVLLNERKLYAVKNKKIILEGFRNKTDGLWDIPVAKKYIQTNNYVPTSSHAAMYSASVCNLSQPIVPQKSKTKPSQNNYLRVFDAFNDLIDLNETNILVDKQLNQDTKDFQLARLTPSINVIIRKKQPKLDLVTFFHGACFAPVASTWIKAIKNGHFTSWPGLTPELVTKHLPTSVYTAKGHLNQEKQFLQSTKQQPKDYATTLKHIKYKLEQLKTQISNDTSLTDVLKQDIIKDAFPHSDHPNIKQHEVVYAVIQDTDIKAYTDLTGRFPYKSSRGNEYLLVGYHYDSNAILAQPLKNREALTITKTWKEMNQRFYIAGVQPNTYIMDNECSATLRHALIKNRITWQLVPPKTHRRNAAERAIQTFKNHLKAGLSILDPNFPVREWDRIILQAELTLNLLRASRVNPKLSAWAYLFGQFNYNTTPIVPPGTKVVVHLKPEERSTWSPNGEVAWSIGPSFDHYRCIKCFFPKTRSERDCDTITFIPHVVPFPRVTTEDFLKQAATDIIRILSQPAPTSIPTLEAGSNTRNALLKLATILKRTDTIPVLDKIQDSALVNDIPKITPLPLYKTVAQPRVSVQQKTVNQPRVTTAPQVINNNTRTWKRGELKIPQTRYNLRSNAAESFRSRAARHILAQHIYDKHYAQHIYAKDGKRLKVHQLLNGKDGPKRWTPALSNEWGRLAQGNDTGVTATDTIDFISFQDVPKHKKVTYTNFTCDYRPLKEEQWRIRCLVGGDKLPFNDDAGSPATDMTETKLLLNSVISDAKKGARFMSMDLKDMFLMTPMSDPEYMKCQYRYFPADIIKRYNLDALVHNNFIYIKIKKGLFGLKQAAILAYHLLSKILITNGYKPIIGSLGMWKHSTRNILFNLCVDDFGVKYFDKKDVQHLITAIESKYTVKTDWTGRNFLGFSIDWQYDKGHVNLTMPKYIPNLLQKLQHRNPNTPQYSPHEYIPIKYSVKGDRQYMQQPDTSAILNNEDTKWVQSAIGSLLYYGRALDNTILPALNQLGTEQALPTSTTKKKLSRLLDYVATYPNAQLRFYASDMLLAIDSDAAYLVMPKARSRLAGYFRLLDRNRTYKHNGAILIECRTIRNVVSSAAEAETHGVFNNAKTGVSIRHLLHEMGHLQPPTIIATDNSTTAGFANNNIQLKRSKSWDMNLHWLRNREHRKQFRIEWQKGSGNTADYHTKHHPTTHHRQMRSKYIRDVVCAVFTTVHRAL